MINSLRIFSISKILPLNLNVHISQILAYVYYIKE